MYNKTFFIQFIYTPCAVNLAINDSNTDLQIWGKVQKNSCKQLLHMELQVFLFRTWNLQIYSAQPVTSCHDRDFYTTSKSEISIMQNSTDRIDKNIILTVSLSTQVPLLIVLGLIACLTIWQQEPSQHRSVRP